MLTKVKNWLCNNYDVICNTNGGQIAVKEGGKITLRDKQNGNTIQQWNSACACWNTYSLYNITVDIHIADLPCKDNFYFAIKCRKCKVINMINKSSNVIYKAFSDPGCTLSAMCSGPAGTLLVYDEKKQALLQLQWQEDRKKFQQVKSIKLSRGYVRDMCYVERYDLVVLSSLDSQQVVAVKLSAGAGVWRLKGKVAGRELDPLGVSCDGGRVYIADNWSNRVLVVSADTGDLLQVALEKQGLGWIHDVRCNSNTNQLLVKHCDDATIYNIRAQ